MKKITIGLGLDEVGSNVTIKPGRKVLHGGCEWVFKEKIDGKYLLQSISKNIEPVLADPKHVKIFKGGYHGQ